MLQCIGQKRVRRHSADPGELVRCENTSETPSVVGRPEFGFLCSTCANSTSGGAQPMQEAFNAAAMQSDIDEYKDSIDSGFMAGIYKSDYEQEEN